MSSKKIILSAESSCDLGPFLKEKYNVNYSRLHILLDDKSYTDGKDISSDDILSFYKQNHKLPKTAAVSVAEYLEAFKKWVDEGYKVIHIGLSSSISATYQNSVIAASELKGVYTIDSKNLSTGIGHLVIEAANRINSGMDASEIYSEVSSLVNKVQSSFVIDNLEFLKAGGRCSALSVLGANILKIKPCIEVNNISGQMSVGKKYRGDLNKVLAQYIKDKLSSFDNIRTDKIFITHTMQSSEQVNKILEYIKSLNKFNNIYETRAGSTIFSHCGPNTLGILFMTE